MNYVLIAIMITFTAGSHLTTTHVIYEYKDKATCERDLEYALDKVYRQRKKNVEFGLVCYKYPYQVNQ